MKIDDLHKLFLSCNGVCTDTRTLTNNQLFFALKGGNFNGNAYAKQAIEKGASYAIIDEAEYEIKDRTILVDNVLACLQELAKFHRLYLKTPIIAVTGSNGKTTTKELLHRVLLSKYNCYATKGNLNNHIGVPLSLLDLTEEHEIAVIEMGANHQGEIASYCTYALPDYGLITNVGKAHLEGFGGIEGVIKGKTELYRFLAEKDGLVFYNADDEVLTEKSEVLDKRFSYGQSAHASFNYQVKEAGEFVTIQIEDVWVQSQLIGSYNAVNLASAAAIGQYFDVPIASIKYALENYQSTNNRSQLVTYGKNQVILDAYNANPTSMRAALDDFFKHPAKKKGVFLGDMYEVGSSSDEEHQLLVEDLSKADLDFYVLVGDQFNKQNNGQGLFFRTTDQARQWFQLRHFEEYLILVKGSRAMHMEDILKPL